MSDNNSTLNPPDYDKVIGLDTMHVMVVDRRIRHIRGYDGSIYLSLVDLMSVFGEDNRKSKKRKRAFNPNSYWNDQKSSILAKDAELSDSIRRLKLPSSDGKFYNTDVAPVWACYFIVLLMDTPAATAFKKSVAKGMGGIFRTIAEIKYRSMNIANGSEWAADSIHEKLENAGLDMSGLFDSSRKDLGYK